MRSSSDYHESTILDQAEQIKAKIAGGAIYGERVDMDNIAHLIVAAYYAGQADITGVNLSRWDWHDKK